MRLIMGGLKVIAWQKLRLLIDRRAHGAACLQVVSKCALRPFGFLWSIGFGFFVQFLLQVPDFRKPICVGENYVIADFVVFYLRGGLGVFVENVAQHFEEAPNLE